MNARIICLLGLYGSEFTKHLHRASTADAEQKGELELSKALQRGSKLFCEVAPNRALATSRSFGHVQARSLQNSPAVNTNPEPSKP